MPEHEGELELAVGLAGLAVLDLIVELCGLQLGWAHSLCACFLLLHLRFRSRPDWAWLLG